LTTYYNGFYYNVKVDGSEQENIISEELQAIIDKFHEKKKGTSFLKLLKKKC
jgi:hypothetical protein